MNKKQILVPIDGTERSMHSLDFIKGIFPTDSVEITIMNVKELILINGMAVSEEMKISEEIGNDILNKAKDMVKDYSVKTYFTFGYAGEEILSRAKDNFIDIIVMTKSTKKGLTRMLGSVTTHVVKGAKCIVMIVPE